ncbi:hypothetical protein GH714_023128 [Hevea brasiliensis]|uniref:Retrovirus-related Pol polyprotein from transposon TNT 1-94-like beta-barrel domain-containing protein n=1 Tax=Hevea brasiliensis TaxID=3981 RepID=A0A6A6LU19_HEVBR|nr:hypothetical protein GH714_023128 [Hevea brasiliensis]
MIGMDALSRKTTFGNRTRRPISVQPLRCSVELQTELEGQETIIPAGGIWRVKANEFCCEEIIPDLLGVLRIKFVGEEEPAATITAHHVRNCAYIFFNEDADHAFTVRDRYGILEESMQSGAMKLSRTKLTWLVGGSDATPPIDDNEARKCRIKVGKALYMFSITAEDELLHHTEGSMRHPSRLTTLFTQTNEAKLQQFENGFRLVLVSQANITISQYFTKVKSIGTNISKLDPENQIGGSRVRRIIILGLRLDYMLQLLSLEVGQRTNFDRVNYKDDYIIDFGCSNHMTEDTGELLDIIEYKGTQVAMTVDNSKLPITHISNKVVMLGFNSHPVWLQSVYHVPRIKKNLLSTCSNFVVFGLDDVKVYRSLKATSEPIVKSKWLESIFMMTAQTTYAVELRKNKIADLWHAWLGHVSY